MYNKETITEYDSSSVTPEQYTHVYLQLIARIMREHGDNPPDEESRRAVARWRATSARKTKELAEAKRKAKSDRNRLRNRQQTAVATDDIKATPADDIKATPAHYLTPVAESVAAKYAITADELRSKLHPKIWAVPREEFAHIAATQCKASTPEIGRYMSDRDHSTIIGMISRYRKMIADQSAEA